MRESNFSNPAQNKACVCISTAIYDRRAIDCTATLPLINSLNHLAYLTSTSPRIREMVTLDGGLERLIRILRALPKSAASLTPSGATTTQDMQTIWKWSLAFQCVVNIGVRGSETVRTRVVEAGMVPVTVQVLECHLAMIDAARERARQEEKEAERRRQAALKSDEQSVDESIDYPRHHHHISRSARSSSRQIEASWPRQNDESVQAPAGPSALRTAVTIDDYDSGAADADVDIEIRRHDRQRTASESSLTPPAVHLTQTSTRPTTPAEALIDVDAIPLGADTHATTSSSMSIDVDGRPSLDIDLTRSGQPDGAPAAANASILASISSSEDLLSGSGSGSGSDNEPAMDGDSASMAGANEDEEMEEGERRTPRPIRRALAPLSNTDARARSAVAAPMDTPSATVVPSADPSVPRRPAVNASVTTQPTRTLRATQQPATAAQAHAQAHAQVQAQVDAVTAANTDAFVSRSAMQGEMAYREEEVLLSLQLLAYLSKYAHVRILFHNADMASPSSFFAPARDDGATHAPPARNVFSVAERFTLKSARTGYAASHPKLAPEIQYWAGVIMRNACRKDEGRGGIRQCANMLCGKWETYPREFAKCRRCRKAKYCSKACQSKGWQSGHRFWCSASQDLPGGGKNPAAGADGLTPMGAEVDGETGLDGSPMRPVENEALEEHQEGQRHHHHHHHHLQAPPADDQFGRHRRAESLGAASGRNQTVTAEFSRRQEEGFPSASRHATGEVADPAALPSSDSSMWDGIGSSASAMPRSVSALAGDAMSTGRSTPGSGPARMSDSEDDDRSMSMTDGAAQMSDSTEAHIAQQLRTHIHGATAMGLVPPVAAPRTDLAGRPLPPPLIASHDTPLAMGAAAGGRQEEMDMGGLVGGIMMGLGGHRRIGGTGQDDVTEADEDVFAGGDLDQMRWRSNTITTTPSANLRALPDVGDGGQTGGEADWSESLRSPFPPRAPSTHQSALGAGSSHRHASQAGNSSASGAIARAFEAPAYGPSHATHHALWSQPRAVSSAAAIPPAQGGSRLPYSQHAPSDPTNSFSVEYSSQGQAHQQQQASMSADVGMHGQPGVGLYSLYRGVSASNPYLPSTASSNVLEADVSMEE